MPLVMHWPAGLPGGRTVDEVIQSIDVMPTLLDLSGIAQPAGLQGQSFVSLLTDGESGPDTRRSVDLRLPRRP